MQDYVKVQALKHLKMEKQEVLMVGSELS